MSPNAAWLEFFRCRIQRIRVWQGRRLVEKSDKLHLKLVAIFFVAAGILILRRPDDFLLPAVWNEDGTLVLLELLNRGWKSIIWPESGYLIIPSRVLSALALAISFSHYASWACLGNASRRGVARQLHFGRSNGREPRPGKPAAMARSLRAARYLFDLAGVATRSREFTRPAHRR